MKRFATFLLAAAFAASAFTACSIAEQASPAGAPAAPSITVNFTSGGVSTKTAFGEADATTYPTFWTAADQRVAMSLKFASPVEATVNKTEDVCRKADFTATFTDTGKPYEFYALSPASAVNAVSESRGSWSVTIPTVQTPKSDGLSCDEAAMLLYAKSTPLQTLPSTAIEMNFSHITSYCRLVLKNLSAVFQTYGLSDSTIKSVDLSYSLPVAGNWYVNATDGSIEENEASYTITLRPTIADLTQPTDIWFALAPCVLDGATVKVSVNTDKGAVSRSYTYGTRTYSAGRVNTLSLDMTKNTSFEEYSSTVDETIYEMVESLSDLSAGDEVIFVDAVSPSCAMTSTLSSTYGFNAVAKDAATGFSYSSEDGYIRLPENSTVMVMTVASKNLSSLTFGYGSKYLSNTTSGSGHYAALSTSPKTFMVEISNGAASISYKSSSGRTTYSYYCTNSYFKIFSSTSGVKKNLAIYRKKIVSSTGGVDPDDDPVLGYTQYGAYLIDGRTVHIPGLTQLSREYGSEGVTFAILFPSYNAVLEISGIPTDAAKGDSFSIIPIKIEGRRKSILGTYEVTVVREEGPTLWLSDFKGNGFIVKR